MIPLRVLWNEVIAFLFICFAVFAAPKVYTSWRGFDGEPGQLFRLVLSSIFLFTMLIYGVFSFLRARKIGRTGPTP